MRDVDERLFSFRKVGIGLTLKNCGRFDESEVVLQKRDGVHQESEGFDARYICSIMCLDLQTSYFLRKTIATFFEPSSPNTLVLLFFDGILSWSIVGVSRFGVEFLMPGSFAAECKSQLPGKRLKLFTETIIPHVTNKQV